MARLILALVTINLLHAQPTELAGSALTYSNRPLGSPSQPLVIRTFMPEPGLGSEVLGRHQRGEKSPKYSPSKGKDIPGNYQPIAGLPAAFGINYGSELSLCWDATECRLLYAWNKGFLDMTPYWGDPKRGNRQSYGYAPKLVGTMFYKAAGKHPLTVNGTSLSSLKKPPSFRGYRKIGKTITFMTYAGGADILTEILPGKAEHALIIRYRNAGSGKIGYKSNQSNHSVKRISDAEIEVTILGAELANYHGSSNKNLVKGGVNAASGKRVFAAMACATCHSLDGSKSHGPSLLGIYGSMRKVKGSDEAVLADDAYILESIRDPNAKVIQGFPKNYMPPYELKKDEYHALLLYIKSINKK